MLKRIYTNALIALFLKGIFLNFTALTKVACTSNIVQQSDQSSQACCLALVCIKFQNYGDEEFEIILTETDTNEA